MSKCLITGAEGFIGSHLCEFLLCKGFDVYASVYAGTENIDHLKSKINVFNCDIRDKDRVTDIVKQVKPDYVFHLAAQSLVIPSWENPKETIEIDILGTMHVLEAIRLADIDPKILVACSSAEYGTNYENEIPVKESKTFRPSSPYGVSKIGTDMFSYLYWLAYNMKIVRVRPFNITGPRKTADACSDFARGIVAVEENMADVMDVGNLETIRDILDYRDGLDAMWLLLEKGTPGEVYNVCSGKGNKMSDIVDTFVSLAKKPVNVRQQATRLRPLDDVIQIGDNTKLRSLGWEPKIPFESTLANLLEYWRSKK